MISFRGCFADCENLTGEIPTGLFKNNNKAKNFYQFFKNCKTLTGTIPAGLFNNRPDADDFGYCFSGCTNLKPTANIFCDEATGKATRFAGKKMNFDGCFKDCGANTDGNGTFPALWEYTMTGVTRRDCFTGAKATNAGSVPKDDGWGTPATTTD